MSMESNLATQIDPMSLRAGEMAPRPQTIEATGLSSSFLCDLVEKHLFEGGVLTLRELVRRTALSGRLLEDVLNFLRKEGRIEVRTQIADDQGLRYGLTDRGRGSALAALTVSGYIGPAPVPLADYVRIVRMQSVRACSVTREHMHKSFADVIMDPAILDRLGPAVNSGKAIFVYGVPGTGKTFITQKLARLFDDMCLIPHAIAVGDTVVRVYDSSIHKQIRETAPSVKLNVGHDPRFVVCRRPVVITGGELTADMLEIQYDPASRQYRAPLQLKANGGIFILDDLGRQRVAPAAVLNRWIVPMEEGADYLTLNTGQHFSTPFDVILVFSTNLNPGDLVDGAFMRRIGYKIRFDALTSAQYHSIWRSVCEENDVAYDPSVCQFTIDALHGKSGTPMLPCHPRDLIGMAVDRMEYLKGDGELRSDLLQWAWDNYFVTDGSAQRV
jgi:hypothetical protein